MHFNALPCPVILRAARRGGRVVECSGLENRRARKGTVSSNLTHAVAASALFPESPEPEHNGYVILIGPLSPHNITTDNW